jgi:hypothetical protein
VDADSIIAKMSAKSDIPNKQLLALFDALIELIEDNAQATLPSSDKIFNATLNKYCIKLSQQSQANHPKILADHILFIAENAFLQQLAHPESKSLAHAKKVAQALILAQTQASAHFFNKHFSRKRVLIGFGSLGVFLIAGLLIWPAIEQNFISQKLTSTRIEINEQATFNSTRSAESKLTAQEASAMYTKFEMMRKGTCRYIEAIQIPDHDKAVYLESVVGGKLPSNLKDLATANAYLEKIDCNYTPMLMQNSK